VTGEDLVLDEFLVDRVCNRLADADVIQRRMAQVELQIVAGTESLIAV
jgi:hypothetical protein